MPYKRRVSAYRRPRSYRRKTYGFKTATYKKRSYAPMKMYKSPIADAGYLAKIKWDIALIAQQGGIAYTQVNWLATGTTGNDNVYFTGGSTA